MYIVAGCCGGKAAVQEYVTLSGCYGFGEFDEIFEMPMRDSVNNDPVNGFVVVNGDVAEPYTFF